MSDREKAMQRLGVLTRDAQGELRPLADLLRDLADRLDQGASHGDVGEALLALGLLEGAGRSTTSRRDLIDAVRYVAWAVEGLDLLPRGLEVRLIFNAREHAAGEGCAR